MTGESLKQQKLRLRTQLFFNCGQEMEPSNIVNIQSAILKLGSSVLILPYTLEFNLTKRFYFVVHKNNKIIGLIVFIQLLYLLYSALPLYRYGQTPALNNSEVALAGRISTSIKSVVLYLVVAKQFISVHAIWNSRKWVSQTHNELARVSGLLSNLCPNITSKQIKKVVWILALIFLFRTCWEVFMTIMRDGGIKFFTPTDYPKLVASQFHAWYSQNSTLQTSFTALEFLGGVSVTIIGLYANIFENFVDFWTLTAAVLLNMIMEILTKNLKNGNIKHEQENQVLELLNRICQFVELTNNTINWIFAANVSITLPYQAAYLMDVFYSEISTVFAINLAINMVFYVGIIVVAVNANSETREISAWFQLRAFEPTNECMNQPMPRRISIILTRLDANAIAFRGGPFFTLTYSFLGNAISFIITYCVIIMQSQIPS